jgi:hypothetical protein
LPALLDKALIYKIYTPLINPNMLQNCRDVVSAVRTDVLFVFEYPSWDIIGVYEVVPNEIPFPLPSVSPFKKETVDVVEPINKSPVVSPCPISMCPVVVESNKETLFVALCVSIVVVKSFPIVPLVAFILELLLVKKEELKDPNVYIGALFVVIFFSCTF